MIRPWARLAIGGAILLGLGAGRATADEATVRVFAAASLTEAFGALAADFARAQPGQRWELNLAGSQTLATQLLEGARADVFAAADEATMERVAAAGALAAPARIFARNRLAIAVEPGNPKHLLGLADLARPGLVLALCAPTVPAGRYTRAAFGRAGVTVPAASEELDVKAALAKVALGEADAAVVYTTDVRAAVGRVEGVPVPPAHNVVARYPIAVLKEAPNPGGARAVLEFVSSPAGRAALERFGFLPP